MGIVVFIRIVYGRFGGHHLGSVRMVHPKGTNFNARTNCGITLLYFYALGIFVPIGRFYLGERSTRYST